MNNEKLTAAMAWLQENAGRVQYGEIGITLVVHAGEVTRIEKIVKEKTK